MRILSNATIRCFVVGLLCVPLSGCGILWVVGLQAQRVTRRVDVLTDTATRFDDCQVNQPCDRNFTLNLVWPTEPWPSIHSGDLPPGFSLSAQPIPEQRDNYLITVEGTPTAPGDYSFQIGFECCMTMSGPMEQARTETITLSVKE